MYYVRRTVIRLVSMAGSIVLIGCLVIVAGLAAPKFFGMETGVVRSGSMEPAIKTGSLIYIQKEASPVETGDVIVFTVSDMTVAHRVIQKNEKEAYLITKGDHNASADPVPVPFDRVEGKVVFCLPAAGYGAAWLESHRLLFFEAAALGALIRMARLWR